MIQATMILLCMLAASYACAGIVSEPYTIYRQRATGWERQVVVERDGVHDTVWVPSDATTVTVDGKTLALPEVPAAQKVRIPRSPTVRTIPPLSIRGTNYLPQDHPWPGIWREATVEDFERDFALMRALHMNTLRTFTFYDEPLYREDGSATALAQKRLNDLLTVAARHGIKVILCPDGGLPLGIPKARRMFKTLLGPFVDDGRILMLDVMNEPGGNDGPMATPELQVYLKEMYACTRGLLPNHLLTVGLCWQFDQLWKLGIKPDVAQYHNYSGAVGRQPKGQPPVRNVSDDLRDTQKFVGNRPLLIGEFGHSTASEADGGVGVERQLEIYRGVLEGAEDRKIVGVLNWTLFDFRPDWMGKKEQVFGIVRLDGTLKPSGILLRDTYARWKLKHPTPWDR